MVRISRTRMDMEEGRIDQAVLRDYGETLVGGASGLNAGSSYAVDLSAGNAFNLILNSATCTFTFSNPKPSGTYCGFTLYLTQDSTGGRLASWPTSVKWAGGTAPTLTTTGGQTDIFTFITVDGGTTWYGSAAGADVNISTSLALFTGGTESDADGYRYHTFTSSDTLTMVSAGNVDILVVGGGGGGGRFGANPAAGGGGGGEVIESLSLSLSSSLSITIGAGGAGRTVSNGDGTNGDNTSVSGGASYTAAGGGGGSGSSGPGSASSGGSGGGGSAATTATTGGSSSTSGGGLGNAGGDGVSSGTTTVRGAGGGGGAGGVGEAGGTDSTGFGGDGGDGYLAFNATRYGAGGGGGGQASAGASGQGGAGGGGDGGNTSSRAGSAATGNGNGGGGSAGDANGGDGSGGIVIVRYPIVTASYRASYTSTSDLTTYTFAASDIGTASADRIVVVGVAATGGTNNTTIASGTIGGISATVGVDARTATLNPQASFMYAAVPSGTTGSIVITFSAGKLRTSISVWAVYGASTTATDSDTLFDLATTSMSLSALTVPTNGMGFFMTVHNNITTTGWGWTNATERSDGTMENSTRYSGADTSTAGTNTITATVNTAPDELALAGIAFGPA